MLTPIAQLNHHRFLHLYRGHASNIYVLVNTEAGDTCLVDCGMPSDAKGLIQTLSDLPPLRRVVCTHFHVDHIAAWPALKQHFRQCDIWFHESAEPYVEGRRAVPMPGIQDMREVLLPCMREYRYFPKPRDWFGNALIGTPFKKGFPEGRVRFFSTGQQILPGFLTIHTPGHLPHDVSFYNPESGHFIAGDFIIVLNNRIKPNTFVTDADQQRASLKRIKRLSGIQTICPGHGPCRPFSFNDLPT